MVKIFDKYNAQAFQEGITPRTRRSMNWFQEKVDTMVAINRKKLFRQSDLSRDVFLGSMIMFFYDPKYEKTLPYYDAFPLVIVIDLMSDGFLGLNLHYLPIDLRANFLFELLKFTTDTNFDEDTRFDITYKYLKRSKRLREFKPCIKRYLTNNIQGNIALVETNDWEVASFLPTEDFHKLPKSKVHKKSREMIR